MDKNLFVIQTDKVRLTWGKSRQKEPAVLSLFTPPPGCLRVLPQRAHAIFTQISRAGVDDDFANSFECEMGPRLYEQIDYRIYVKSLTEEVITVQHVDPVILADLVSEEGNHVIHGYINFRSQVGRSTFMVLVGGKPEFEFEIQVFPSKLDYEEDYRNMVADVQDTLSGLALEFLKSTFSAGQIQEKMKNTALEWVVLLQHVIDDLVKSLRYINSHPIKGLTREVMLVRPEKIKHVDHIVRNAVRKMGGLASCTHVKLSEQRPLPTLDTPEHRWLALQMRLILDKLQQVYNQEKNYDMSVRRQTNLLRLQDMQKVVQSLCSLKALTAVSAPPPSGFASLQLLKTPGYREAYQCCMILSLGLKLQGGPIHVSVKNIDLLYEYWCYLAVLKSVAAQINQPIPGAQLLKIKQNGLQVLLERGRAQSVDFKHGSNRNVCVTYNPKIKSKYMLLTQQPDIMITVKDDHWPEFHMVMDAKYRVDASDEYIDKYKTPGPPEDAINVLHRYRDAILEKSVDLYKEPKKTVIQAAALFPFRENIPGAYGQSQLAYSLKHIGIGAIPMLPGGVGYLDTWLKEVIHTDCWTTANEVISYSVQDKFHDWRKAAAEIVLVGVLRGSSTQEHWQWIKENKLYYVPLLKTQQRQFNTKWIAIYSSLSLKPSSGVYDMAKVVDIKVVRRHEIKTPWKSTRSDENDWQVVYQLEEIKSLPKPILNVGEQRRQPFLNNRWTTRLGIERAKVVEELLLETQPEWKLYELLELHSIPFTLVVTTPKLIDEKNPVGRVWFVLSDAIRVRYQGVEKFVVKDIVTGREDIYADEREVIKRFN